ncbi:hypothetical protein NG798_14520 [Ancylothrix sp. C2]|nr:hypothetical protein [Ancylothrix sp. D3o]MCT7951010.1 hypothetical protein [Ancylothrix sp. D3o]
MESVWTHRPWQLQPMLTGPHSKDEAGVNWLSSRGCRCCSLEEIRVSQFV